MTTIRTFTNQADAGFVVSFLQSRGFDAGLLDEASHAWNYSWMAIPIRLQVPDEQVRDASACLASADSETSSSESGDNLHLATKRAPGRGR